MGLNDKFTPAELTVTATVPAMFGPDVELYTTPITPKENMLRLYEGKTPMWTPFPAGDFNMLMLDCDPENQARSPGTEHDRLDGWGVEWIYVDVVGGAMVKPGNPKVLDINNWEDYVTPPDPDTWDWEGCYERTKDQIRPDRATIINVPGCLFERMIALMDFDNAIVALIDDEQKDAVHRLLRVVTDIHKKFYTNCKKWFNPEVVNFNDDWGSQRAEFFSVPTVREMLLPYVKEIGDHVHSLGMYWDLHSCGKVENFVPIFIEAGLNSWGGQPINDKYGLKQKYGEQFIFTHGPQLSPEASEEEIDKAVAEFMATIGSDNRVLCEAREPAVRRKIYEASRKNFDRMVEDGTAIL